MARNVSQVNKELPERVLRAIKKDGSEMDLRQFKASVVELTSVMTSLQARAFIIWDAGKIEVTPDGESWLRRRAKQGAFSVKPLEAAMVEKFESSGKYVPKASRDSALARALRRQREQWG